METASLKSFATWARTALIREVAARAAAVLAQDPVAASAAMDAHMRSAANRLRNTLDRSTHGEHDQPDDEVNA